MAPLASDPLLQLRLAWLSGDDAQVERTAATASDREVLGACAVAAAVRDDDLRARDLLATASDTADFTFVARAVLAERAGGDRPRGLPPTARGWRHDEVRLAESALARAEGDLEHAAEAALAVRQSTDPVSASLARAALGEIACARGDLAGAHEALSEAIAALSRLGLRRAAGRALLRHALLVAPHIGHEGPAVWLSRAQAELGERCTFRDRAALRGGFRAHGRRLPDASLSGDALERTVDIERGAVRLRSLGLRAGGAFEELDDAVHRIEDATAGLLDLTTASLVERSRTRHLARAFAELDALTDLPAFARRATEELLSALSADAVVLLSSPRGAQPTILASAGTPPPLEELRVAALSRTIGSTPPARDQRGHAADRPLEPVLVAPISTTGMDAVLYADRRARAGRFAEADAHLATLASELLARGFARVLAGAAERAMFGQLGATLEAIRDGVVALDHRHTILRVNQAGARMLRARAEDLVGKGAHELPGVAPLFAELGRESRLDGAIVRLPHGSLVVTARPVHAEGGEARGVVATLVELDRAQRIAARITQARPRYSFRDVIGESPVMLEAKRLAQQAASVDANVLITGESGTGKEVLAQSIHTGGARAGQPFVGINCAALPRDLLEAELFGYERGAFTGARSEGMLGKLEVAGHGTLLLDEIGDMPIDMQAKLLRVLQERSVVRLGGSTEHPISARVIATTHRNLDVAVEQGSFRLDLLYRLRVLALHLPPLRERTEDIPLLARDILRRIARAQGKRVTELSEAVEHELVTYNWPGNVRELGNVMEREVSLLDAHAATLVRLSVHPAALARFAEPPSSVRAALSSTTTAQPSSDRGVQPLADLERQAVVAALRAFDGNVTQAAKALGISRVTFYAKLKEASRLAGPGSGGGVVRSIGPSSRRRGP